MMRTFQNTKRLEAYLIITLITEKYSTDPKPKNSCGLYRDKIIKISVKPGILDPKNQRKGISLPEIFCIVW